jgi:enoyl-CoA hydratase/carnithine racemase
MEQIKCEVASGILTITLDRPDKLNAFTGQMMAELLDVFDRADADDEVRVVIVTGSGRAFCAGADLSQGGATFDPSARGSTSSVHRDGGGRVALRIYACTKPVIAAINGPAVGVGVTMTLPMDMRLASENSRFGLVFTRRGITPEACSSWFLPRLVGVAQAQEWTLTGRIFDAQEALDGGLVRSVHAPDELLPAAQALAREIIDNTAPVSVALARQLLWRMLGADHPMEAHKVDSRAIAARGSSADAREGVTSFLEKRQASFPLRVSDGMPSFYPWWAEPEFE